MNILIKLWVLVSVACVAGGWILSALHQLNMVAYLVYFGVVTTGFGVWVRLRGAPIWRWDLKREWPRLRRRFTRLLPRVYGVGVVIVFLGGALYAPRNYDALSYRVPRVLHWWAAGGWHWISTPNDRMNLSGTGFEWMMLPLLAITHSDRLFFLINFAGYLIMPSLVFGVFSGLGVPRRAAWYWMWLLPMALCYIMQAGSIGNDSIAVSYLLASIWFGLRAARNNRVSDLWMAILAGALLTGVKGSNLPLPLPVFWAVLPAVKLFRRRLVAGLVVFLLAILVSYAPILWLNQLYTGHWTGDPYNADGLQVRKPLAGIVGNSIQLAVQCLEPPFLPAAGPIESWIGRHMPPKVVGILQQEFPHFYLGFQELPQEEACGLGLGFTLLATLALGGAITRWRSRPFSTWPKNARRGLVIGLLAWVSLFAYMTKLGSESTGRLVAAYYPLLLLPIILHPYQEKWARRRLNQVLGVLVGAASVAVLILTPSRPLWPAGHILGALHAEFPRNELIARAYWVYHTYDNRNDVFADLRGKIPASVSTIGVIEDSDDMESSLWRPFGRRSVIDLIGVERTKPAGTEWVVVKDHLLNSKNRSFEQWINENGGTLVSTEMLISIAHCGPEKWSLVHFSGSAQREEPRLGNAETPPATGAAN